MSRISWTKQEIIYLAKNYNSLDINKISEELNRSITSIYVKASKLWIRKGRDNSILLFLNNRPINDNLKPINRNHWAEMAGIR